MGTFGYIPDIKRKLMEQIDQAKTIAVHGKDEIQRNNAHHYDNARLVSAYRDLLLDIAEAQVLVDTVPDYETKDLPMIAHDRLVGKLWRRLNNLEFSIYGVTAELY